MGSMYKSKTQKKHNMRVSWNEQDSLGKSLRDNSENDLNITEGLSELDLSNIPNLTI